MKIVFKVIILLARPANFVSKPLSSLRERVLKMGTIMKYRFWQNKSEEASSFSFSVFLSPEIIKASAVMTTN